ncbi:MAG TPA: hypothetical protein VEB60_02270 [Candidatus Paceibacterota bacterium]|nr:hypothetical protein [Candidatus Paceibacterota bacterium]
MSKKGVIVNFDRKQFMVLNEPLRQPIRWVIDVDGVVENVEVYVAQATMLAGDIWLKAFADSVDYPDWGNLQVQYSAETGIATAESMEGPASYAIESKHDRSDFGEVGESAQGPTVEFSVESLGRIRVRLYWLQPEDGGGKRFVFNGWIFDGRFPVKGYYDFGFNPAKDGQTHQRGYLQMGKWQ